MGLSPWVRLSTTSVGPTPTSATTWVACDPGSSLTGDLATALKRRALGVGPLPAARASKAR